MFKLAWILQLTLIQLQLAHSILGVVKEEPLDETKTIRKCCPLRQVWDINQKGCVQVPRDRFGSSSSLEQLIQWPITENYTQLEPAIIIGHSCVPGTSLQRLDDRVDFKKLVRSNGNQLILQNDVLFGWFPYKAFCLDRATTSHKINVMVCLDPLLDQALPPVPTIKVTKCCPEGQRYVPPRTPSSRPQCELIVAVPIRRSKWSKVTTLRKNFWYPTVINIGDYQILQVRDESWSTSYGFPVCDSYQSLKSYSPRQIEFFESGKLLVKAFQQARPPIVHPPNKFCVDETSVNGKNGNVALACDF